MECFGTTDFDNNNRKIDYNKRLFLIDFKWSVLGPLILITIYNIIRDYNKRSPLYIPTPLLAHQDCSELP